MLFAIGLWICAQRVNDNSDLDAITAAIRGINAWHGQSMRARHRDLVLDACVTVQIQFHFLHSQTGSVHCFRDS